MAHDEPGAVKKSGLRNSPSQRDSGSLALDIVGRILPVVLLLFCVRLLGIFIGAFRGGLIAGDPLRYNHTSWMALITQAGIGIGLAKELAIKFPEWGHTLATVVISVIVLNQIVEPPFFKLAIRRVGESHLPRGVAGDRVAAVILGIAGQSITLARQLRAHNWKVIMADTDATHVERIATEGIDSYLLPAINRHVMSNVLRNDTFALVAMLHDDQANYEACELAYRIFAVPRIIVRLKDILRAQEFLSLGAVVINPGSAMVNLLDQSVRSPESAVVVLHQDSEFELVQVVVNEADVTGVPLRDFRLPNDVLVLSVQRDGHSMVAHGYITLQMGDEVNLMGTAESLEEVARRVGWYHPSGVS